MVGQGEEARRQLYRELLNDKSLGYADRIKKYSFQSFQDKLLNDDQAQARLTSDLIEKGRVKSGTDFYEKYILDTPKQAPAPKAAPVAPFQQPVEPMAMEGIPVSIAAPKPTKAPAPSVTDYAREMAFEPQIESLVKPIGVMAPQPIQEPIPSVTETAREMAFQPPAAPKKPKEKERGFMEWTGDVFGTISAGGERIAKNILAGIGHYAQAQAATDPMASLPYEKRQQMLQEAGQTMYDIADAAQRDFQNEVAKRNIETSVLQAIDKKQYKNIPEAVLYTVGDAAMQIIPSVLTMGGSTYLQTLPAAYKDGIEAIAKEKGISPEQVIASGDDAIVVAGISTGFQSALENIGAGQVSKAIASKGAYKAIRDWLLKQNVNKNLARGAALLGVGVGEGTTEYLQEGTGQTGVIAAKSPTTKAFFERLPNELFTEEAEKQRRESFVGGLIGGGGLAGVGQAITKAFEKPPVAPEAPVAPVAPVAPEAPIVPPAAPPVVPPAAPEALSQEEIDARIEEGQKRTGYVYTSPLQSLTGQAQSIIDSVAKNKYIGLAPVKSLFEELYDAYKIFGKQQTSTVRNLTTDQIAQGVADFEETLSLLGEYISKREGGDFVREYVGRKAQEEQAATTPPVAPIEEAPIEEAPVEETPVEEVTTPETGMFAGIEGPTEEAPATAGMFEGITGPPQEAPVAAEEAPVAAEEELVAAVPAAPAPKGKGVSVEFPTELSVSEVKPYAEVPDNYYRPDQQLKFNQGNYYEPVRVIAHPDVIRAISIGSKLGKFEGKKSTISDADIDFAGNVAKKLGYTSENGEGSARLLSNAVKDLAKENRSKNEEVFMVIGNEAKAPKPAPVTPPAAPKAQPVAEKKEEKSAPKAEPKEEKPTTGMPEEGSKVNLPPQTKYSTNPRKMVFKDGQWKEEVGGELTSVGESVQQQAQEAFSGKMEAKPVAEAKGGAKESLAKRLKGDALLDAEDTLAELSDNGATINPDGTVVVYHRTSKYKADDIVKNNEMFGLEDGVFFSTS